MKNKIKKSLGNLKDKVVPASEIAPPKQFKDGGTMLDDMVFDKIAIEKQLERLKTLEVIEEFCNKQGITPLELIEAYKTKGKGKKVSESEENKAKTGKPDRSNFASDLRKAKCGF